MRRRTERPLLHLFVLLLSGLATASGSAYDPIEDSPFARPFKAGCNASVRPAAPSLFPRGSWSRRRAQEVCLLGAGRNQQSAMNAVRALVGRYNHYHGKRPILVQAITAGGIASLGPPLSDNRRPSLQLVRWRRGRPGLRLDEVTASPRSASSSSALLFHVAAVPSPERGTC